MLGYVDKVRHKYQHPMPKSTVNAPAKFKPSQYGAKFQTADVDTSPQLPVPIYTRFIASHMASYHLYACRGRFWCQVRMSLPRQPSQEVPRETLRGIHRFVWQPVLWHPLILEVSFKLYTKIIHDDSKGDRTPGVTP